MARLLNVNRIRELRESLSVSRDELAGRMGTTTQTIGRHERGDRRLTIQWINRYAAALEVAPADIMIAEAPIETEPEVEAAVIEGMPHLSVALGAKGMQVYRVLVSLVPDVGIRAGDLIVVDGDHRWPSEALRPGDVLLVRYEGTSVLALRQFLPPALIVTNAPGPRNVALRLDDRSVRIEVIGRVIRA